MGAIVASGMWAAISAMGRYRALLISAGLALAPHIARADDTPAPVEAPDNLQAAAATAPDPAPKPAHWELDLGASYSDGTYDDMQKSYVTAIPVSLRYAGRHVWARVSVPYVILRGGTYLADGPQPFWGGGGHFGPPGGDLDEAVAIPRMVPGGNPFGPPPSIHTQGLGDVAITLGYRFDLGDTTQLSLSTRVKLPTARVSQGLGTGRTDVVLGGDLSQDLGGTTITVGARRRFTGQPDGFVLRNTWSLDADLAWHLVGRVLVGVDYEWLQSVVPGFPVSNNLTGWTSIPLSHSTRIDFYGGAGLSNGSTALLGGAALRWKFG
jgi:hypothetical protein